MPDFLKLRIEPKESVDSVEAETLQVRLSYEIPGKDDEGEPITHPGSELVRLDRNARAEARIEPVALDKPVSAILENRQGLEIADLGSVNTAAAANDEAVVLAIPAATIKQALTRLEPDEQPALVRSGRFIRLGKPEQRFDGYALSVDLVDTAAKQNALKALLGLADGAALQTNAKQVPLDATTAGQLGALSLTAADLKFDGSFQIRRPFHPRTEAPGWVWMLNGPELLIGYREDAELRVPQHDLRILLPWQDDEPAVTDGTPSDSTSGSTNPPLDVDEGSLLNEPDLFSDDPGSFCKPFSNPARILGERRFHTVFRVEQPEIESTSNNRPDYSGLLHPKDMIQPMVAMNAMVASPVGGGNVVSPVPTITNLGSGLNRFIPRDSSILRPPSSAVDFLPFPKLPWRNRRQPVGPDNPIDWDGDSTQYQALSVAGGHIMEWRVQWRSNGYSLGDVAHTLTLAPRQTRRIVKLDWRRREQSVRRERTEFGEEVAQTTLRERDYNDAVRSNLNEWSKGGSKSQTTGVAGGIGFAMGPVVIGGGAAHGRASSSSWQQGGRSVAAAEEQSLRDAVRQFGDSLRQFESTVVNEVSQDESIEGVSEVVRNPNYCHSLTVIYHEILRHMRVDTVLAGVRECLFVPFSIRPFTLARIARWQDIFERYLLKPELRWALKYSDEIARSWAGVELPPDGPRKSQYLVSLSGSIYIKLGIERPRDEVMSDEIDDQLKEDGAVGERVTTKVWQTYASILPIPVGQIVARIRSYTASQRDTYFQREIAPAMARRWVDRLTVSASSGPLQGADFTLVGEYGFNRTVRVDFTVPAAALQDARRESIETLILSATEHLPKGSVANVTDANVEFHTDHYHRRVNSSGGTDDLISPPAWDDDESTRPAPTESATLSFTASHWENQNPRRKAEEAIDKILDHVNDNLHYYHKVLWWTMDRDELYMLLDGFAISTSDRRSIASVVEREPIAILGNALVFRVAAGAFLGVNGHKSYEDAFKYYKGEGAPSTPMRVSLPTDGLYAQAIMDQCEACEEHEGSTDWVLNDDDPALAEFPSNFFDSRRSQPQNTTPTDMPDSIINLQNAPAAPAPQGFGDILSTLGSNSAFRDMAGLEGTQKNALGALNSAANLAGQFGGFALQARLAELQAERDAGKNFDKKRAAVDRAVKNGSISKSDGEAALRKEAEQMGQKTAKGVSDRAKSIIDDFGNNRDVTITEQDTDGSRTVTVKKPEPTDSGDDQNKPPQKKEPTAAELDEQRRLEAQAPLYFLEEKRPGVWELVLLNFAVESSKLKPGHEEGLRAASHLMTEDPSLGTYKTEAYTSTTGSAAFNKELAWKRARSALDGIREKGIPDVQIDGTEFSTFRIQPVGEARSLASYLRDNGYPIPDTLPAENPYDRGVVIQLSVYPELRQVDAAAPYWKQPTKDWRMRLLYPKDDTGPDLSIPTSVKDVFNLGRYGEVDFEAYGIYDVNGTPKNGPLIKGSLRGNLIKAVALAKSQRDDWTDWLELTLDHAPMATVEQDWHSAEVSLIGGQLDMFISKLFDSNPILRNLVDIEDVLEEIRSQYNIPQGGQYVLRILRHMTSFTAPFTFEHIEHERILFVALQVPLPDIVEEWIGGIPPAEFAIASIAAQPFVDN
ncbi:OmpA family protein [Marinobacter salinexigens]|uniref:OmpA family protein n=1 Tax=Marinobacter salinexigens TaxID=2919747 RepID=A0A5B0VGU9_9GAMM|nr:OmpA family protein [Marinobacter salinexigens]KAA1173830.1 OmpA family protein [Marinobacter salinexigens]